MRSIFLLTAFVAGSHASSISSCDADSSSLLQAKASVRKHVSAVHQDSAEEKEEELADAQAEEGVQGTREVEEEVEEEEQPLAGWHRMTERQRGLVTPVELRSAFEMLRASHEEVPVVTSAERRLRDQRGGAPSDCSRLTEGTCAFLPCYSWRNAECVHGLCTCAAGLCAQNPGARRRRSGDNNDRYSRRRVSGVDGDGFCVEPPLLRHDPDTAVGFRVNSLAARDECRALCFAANCHSYMFAGSGPEHGLEPGECRLLH